MALPFTKVWKKLKKNILVSQKKICGGVKKKTQEKVTRFFPDLNGNTSTSSSDESDSSEL